MADLQTISPRLAAHHARTRTRGVNTLVYWIARAILQPAIHVWFRISRTGREHIPRSGPVILASNHRSFLDPFVIGCCLRRPVYFVAKQELFENRLIGWLLNCLGAFPVRRGQSDEEAIATSRAILARGDVLVIFPEGTRIRTGSLGTPKRGVGRMALESGAPVIPVAVLGSERARRGWAIRPVKVRIRCGRPLTFPRVDEASPHLAAEVSERIWPCVELQWEWLGGLPPLRKAAVVGAGSMGTAVATLLARAGLEVQLGCRTAAQAERIAATGRNDGYLPELALPDGVAACTVADIEFAGVDLVVLAVPSSSLPVAVGKIGDRVGARSAVLVVSKGLVPPQGELPSRYVGDRIDARAVAALGGPSHAAEAVREGAAVVLATEDDDLRRQLPEALGGAGIDVTEGDDPAAVELAACAKNAATLAAAAAAPSGANAAGAAAGRVFAELHHLAAVRWARRDAFAGLAGVGDLVATVLADSSRNRRAGELLAAGIPPGQVQASLPGAAEALSTVPLLAAICERDGIDAPALTALAGLVEGRLGRDDWLELVSGGGERRAA
jgi:glycerol-3-phosphate dehydrogenase (NAD(P)+)